MKFALERAVKQTMYDLMKETMKLAPEDTGNLRRSHSVDMRLSSSIIEGLLKNSANYWVYQNFGTSKTIYFDFKGVKEQLTIGKISLYEVINN